MSIYDELTDEEEFIVICFKCEELIDIREAQSDGWRYYCPKNKGCSLEKKQEKDDRS